MKSFPELSWFQRNASEKSVPNDTGNKPSPSFQGGSVVKNVLASGGDTRDEVQFLDQKGPWRRKWRPTPVFLPRESHGQRSLAGYSPPESQRLGHDWMTEHINISTSSAEGLPLVCVISVVLRFPHVLFLLCLYSVFHDHQSTYIMNLMVARYISLWLIYKFLFEYCLLDGLILILVILF